jgi:hypothetical protein
MTYRYQVYLIFPFHPAGEVRISALIKEIKPVKEIINPLGNGYFFLKFETLSLDFNQGLKWTLALKKMF